MAGMFKCLPMPSSQTQRAARLAVLLAILLAWPWAVVAATFEVNLSADRADADLADGLCDTDTAKPGEQCSLRAGAEQIAALPPGAHQIRIPQLPAGKVIRIEHGPIRLNNGTRIDGTTSRLTPLLLANPDHASGFLVDGDVEISGLDIDLSAQRGPAISSLQRGASLRLSDTRIHAANPAGVALRLAGGRLDCLRCRLVDNASTAIEVSGGELRLVDSLISDNHSDADGGGLRINGGNVWLQRSEVSRNRSEADGGGIRQTGGELRLINSLLRGNLAARGGGGLAISAGLAELQNSSITGNVANTDARGNHGGGGIFSSGSGDTRLRNSIVSANRALASSAGNECLGEGISAEAANLIGDDPACRPHASSHQPLLRSATPLIADLRQLPWGGVRMFDGPGQTSPAINAGIGHCLADIDLDQNTADEPLRLDLRGQPRPPARQDARCDLGAIESHCGPRCGQSAIANGHSNAETASSATPKRETPHHATHANQLSQP